MLTPVQLRCFTSSEDPALYHQYLSIKHEVFVAEQGWTTLADPTGRPIARAEAFDEQGQLCVATAQEGNAIGVVRGIALSRGFPHRELLEHHLHRPVVEQMWAQLCTFNALAVLPSHRRKVCEAAGLGWTGTVAKLLMLFVIHQMELRSLKAALATAGSVASARLCRSIGFFVIDRPTRAAHLHPNIVATNIGMVFGSPPHRRAQEVSGVRVDATRPLAGDGLRLLRYFEEREAKVLQASGVDELIRGEARGES